MNAHYLSAFLYFSPYLLIFFGGLSIEIVLFRRIRRKQGDDKLLREKGASISGSVVTCRQRTRMADITCTYEVQGKIYTLIQHVPEVMCKTVHHGDAVVVFYDGQQPERSLLKDIEREYVEVFPATSLFLILLMYGLFIALLFAAALITYFVGY